MIIKLQVETLTFYWSRRCDTGTTKMHKKVQYFLKVLTFQVVMTWLDVYKQKSRSTVHMYNTVELSGPPLSRFLVYPNFFSGPNLNINFVSHDQDPHSHIFSKTTALKSAVECKVFLLSKSKSSTRRCCNKWRTLEWVLIGSDRVALFLSEISRSMACSALYGKCHKCLFTSVMSLKRKQFVLAIKDAVYNKLLCN